ncbi:Serine/threonine protein kinase [uncultured Mycobacterium sp.]|uniref:non-specific serine/threonine protein kinase n=1 Tax=uncultured Mycobacterium sp. TaxID=171292 RepID=A0A1Y5PJZ4_9MYCO|nr:Serine/threonine protein kinase [uncultured Mycobacterium sp.]
MEPRDGTSFGKYTISRLLGRGGMGEVYEAYDTAKGRAVALKILSDGVSHDPAFRARFQRESQAAAILQEPHVIPIHDWGEFDGRLYIDMRLVQGQTLAEMIKQGPLAPARAVGIVTQMAAALDAAHAAGLIHRDVKPENIIVTPADFAYLVDFGIAETKGATRLTEAGSQIGTLKYMAPERFNGEQATPAVDVYALTCVMYEMLTGETPFAGDSLESQVGAHLTLPPPRPATVNPRVPAAFDDVVARGMAKDPDDRYGTAGGLGRAAQRALQFAATARHAAPTATSPSATGPTAITGFGGRRRSWLLPTAIAVAAALILGGIGVIIGLLARDHSGQAMGPVVKTAEVVPGPDQSALHQSCDDGFTLPNADGFGTHAGRGTAETTCLFTKSVLTSYWAQYGNASGIPRAVSAPGAVDCRSVPGAQCNGSNFVVQCQQYPGDNWITCTGGNNARVYLW